MTEISTEAKLEILENKIGKVEKFEFDGYKDSTLIPPDLARVLLAIQNLRRTDGSILKGKVLELWNLEKTLLREQLEEVISFLYDLLITK